MILLYLMGMLTILVLTLIPTLLFYLVTRQIFPIKSFFLRLGFSWFLGQYLFVWTTFLLALLLAPSVTGVLQKASFIAVITFALILLFYGTKQENPSLRLGKLIKSRDFIIGTALMLFALVFSYFFFSNHLSLQDGKIYTSIVYWDFKWHMPLIQSFVYGDNFPPQNESFAGVPATYHFFWGLLVASYSSLGLSLVTAINFVTIMTLFILFLTILGFTQEVFKSLFAGVIASLLLVTTSSLHVLAFLMQTESWGLMQAVYYLFTNSINPFHNSFLPGHPFGYNGTMFNMFYFLAERQMIPGIIFCIFSLWVIYKRKYLSNTLLLIIGGFMGFYFLWHLYITIMVLCAVIFTFFFAKDKVKILYLLLPFTLIFLLHYFYFKNVQDIGWFLPEIAKYPAINFHFPSMDYIYPLSFSGAIRYYVFAYGVKIFLLFAGMRYLWKNNKELFWAFFAFIFPTFLLINTIQLSPLSIYDNHKWLRPLNVIFDLVCAYFLYEIYLKSQKTGKFIIGILLLFAVTASALVELPPFFNARPNVLFANTASPLIRDIRTKTPQEAVFVGSDTIDIQYAGRKLFLGDYSGQDLKLDKQRRVDIINAIYYADSVERFCQLTQEYNISFVEGFYIERTLDVKKKESKVSYLNSVNGNNKKVSFVDVDKTCNRN